MSERGKFPFGGGPIRRRVGGDTFIVSLGKGFVPGIPPRGRGYRSICQNRNGDRRITAAQAGLPAADLLTGFLKKEYHRAGGAIFVGQSSGWGEIRGYHRVGVSPLDLK